MLPARSPRVSSAVDTRIRDDVDLHLLERSSGTFRIRNNRSEAIRLKSLYPQDEVAFFPTELRYAVKTDPGWRYFNSHANAISYSYTLNPGESVDFQVDIDRFEDLGVARGSLVKLCVGEFHSRAFLW